MLTQVPLEIYLQYNYTFNNYYMENNLEAFNCLKKISCSGGEQFVYLWGANGVGKTHLLQAACNYASAQNIPAFYLPLCDLKSNLSEQLCDLENVKIICLDGIDHIVGNLALEQEIFYFFNKIRERNNKLIISAKTSPAYLDLKLPDLKSRLSWGVVYQIHALDDQGKLIALKLHANCRGLELDDLVGGFLLHHCTRDMLELINILDKLDQESLAKQRRLTIPFVKQVLGI